MFAVTFSKLIIICRRRRRKNTINKILKNTSQYTKKQSFWCFLHTGNWLSFLFKPTFSISSMNGLLSAFLPLVFIFSCLRVSFGYLKDNLPNTPFPDKQNNAALNTNHTTNNNNTQFSHSGI